MSNLKTIDALRRVIGLGEAGYYQADKDCDYDDAIDECVDAIEREVSERFMELPLDADDVPIHVGDCLQLGDTHGEVVALTYCPANGKLPWEWQCDTGDWYNTAFAYHAKPRTLEDVLREFGMECADDAYATDEAVAICAAKIRELWSEVSF